MSIRDQILHVCMDLFDSQIQAIYEYEDWEKELMPASIPKAMIIHEFRASERNINNFDEVYRTREITNSWIYKDGILSEIEKHRKPDLSFEDQENLVDGYFKETYVRFVMSEEKKMLLLDVYFAPKYGRGWKYPLIDSKSGLILGEPVLKWIS